MIEKDIRCNSCGVVVFLLVFIVSLCCAATTTKEFEVIPAEKNKYALVGKNLTIEFTINNLSGKNLKGDVLSEKGPDEIKLQVKLAEGQHSVLWRLIVDADGSVRNELQNAWDGDNLQRYMGRTEIKFHVPNVIFTLYNVSLPDYTEYRIDAIETGAKQWNARNMGAMNLEQAHAPEILQADFFPKSLVNRTSSDEFICRAIGTPTPRVQWMVGTNIKGSFGIELATLSIHDAKTTDTKMYICRAENVGGVVEKQMSLLVAYLSYDGDQKSREIQKKVQVEGGRFTAMCNIDGYPSPNYKWYDPSGAVIRTTREIEYNTVFGNYTCVADNASGVKKYVVELKEEIKNPETSEQADKNEQADIGASSSSSNCNRYVGIVHLYVPLCLIVTLLLAT